MRVHKVSPQLLREMRRRHLVSFVAKVFETISTEDEFVPNWHLEAIAWELEQIEFGHSRRLLVTMPPRHLKSIMISVAWVAWMLGRYPTRRYVCVSYSNELAADLAKMCKQVMQAEWYRELFPKTVLKGRAPDMDFRTTAGGGRMATSTGGTLTGRGGECIIIDDPVKPVDAMSPTMRENCISWYKNTLVTRLNRQDTGSIIIVMQRIHEEDLAGHVLQEGGWQHLNLPAIAIEPERVQIGPNQFYTRTVGVPLNPLHTSLAALETLRRTMGPDFEAHYQQQPIPAGGLMFRRSWLRFHEGVKKEEYGDVIVQSWDTAASERISSDFSACVTALVRGSMVYVLDVYRARINFPKLLNKTIELAREWQIDALLVEDAASGKQLIQQLHNLEPRGVPLPIRQDANTPKEVRAWGQTAMVQSGGLLLPKQAEWLDTFLQELLGFPKARKDDQVDALVHLLNWSSKRPKPSTAVGFPEIYVDGEWIGGDDFGVARPKFKPDDFDFDDYLDAWVN